MELIPVNADLHVGVHRGDRDLRGGVRRGARRQLAPHPGPHPFTRGGVGDECIDVIFEDAAGARGRAVAPGARGSPLRAVEEGETAEQWNISERKREREREREREGIKFVSKQMQLTLNPPTHTQTHVGNAVRLSLRTFQIPLDQQV